MELKAYIQPLSISDALLSAREHSGGFRFLAGGTDVMVNRFQENETSPVLIDLSKIEELKTIHLNKEHLVIGSLVTLEQLSQNETVKKYFPVLRQAALSVATPVIRKSATVGGNIFCENRCVFYNQSHWWRTAAGNCLKCSGDTCIATGGKKNCFSKFVSDAGTALISLDAYVTIEDTNTGYTEHLEDLYTGDGVHPRSVQGSSLVKSILVPLNEVQSIFKKLRPRKSLEFTSLTTVVSRFKSGRIKIAMAGVDPAPIVVDGNRNDTVPELILSAFKKARVVNNDFYSREYRREMINVFLKKSFDELDLLK